MTVEEYLRGATARLRATNVDTARLDALVLLEDCLGEDRAHLLAHPEIELRTEQVLILNEQIIRRSRHIPLAYIRGKTEFYGRTFTINENVLEPRPESEMMIDQLKYLPGSDRMVIADIGTGSGALAITVKLDLPDSEVLAVDIDERCLDLTRHNAQKLKADITLFKGDLLAPVLSEGIQLDALLCNLPYVPDSFEINTAARHEPRLAIFGGPDGLEPYRRLFAQIQESDHKPRYILTESLPQQHQHLSQIAAEHSLKFLGGEDFIQIFSPI